MVSARWSTRVSPAGVAASRSWVGTNSVSHTCDSPAESSMKCITLLPMPRMAGMSSSPGPTGWAKGCAPSAVARATVLAASATFNPKSQTPVPWVT